MLYVPLTTNPLGWVILGLSGYALYKAGKKKGQDEAAAAEITAAPEPEETTQTKKGDK